MRWKIKTFEELSTSELYDILVQRCDILSLSSAAHIPTLTARTARHGSSSVTTKTVSYTHLLPRIPSVVPSTMECLTAGFGMEPGGSTPLLPLETL